MSRDLDHGLRKLRHLYEQMISGDVRPSEHDIANAARGLLGPATMSFGDYILATYCQPVVPLDAMRNHLVLVARGRNAGPMKDRRAPRGGQRNVQRDFLDEYGDEMDDTLDPWDDRTACWRGDDLAARSIP